MPRALAVPVRRVIFRRWQQGQEALLIAAALRLPVRTVRHLLRRWRLRGPDALPPAYAQSGPRRTPAHQQAYQAAVQLKREHPGWGAGLIRVVLTERKPARPFPSERTLQRWFCEAGLAPAPRGRRPRPHPQRAQKVHQVWQMDATEQVPLRDGRRVSWLRMIDEYSGAVLWTAVFDCARWADVEEAATQVELRRAFTRWGRPERLRVDNGSPWGSTGGLPTELALWVIGLGVGIIWNHPHRPQENGVVERSQGVSKQWVEPQTCASSTELRRRLHVADRRQREQYPSIEGRSRWQAFPGLAHSGRRYDRSWEERHWSLGQVLDCLAGYAVWRQVDHSGKVSLYDRGHAVGKAHQGETVYVTLDPETQEWVFADKDGRELRRRPATEIRRERIMGLQVARHR